MLDDERLMQIAVSELIKIFGKDYLKKNYQNTCRAYGMISEHTYQFFVDIKDFKDLPDRKATEKGGLYMAKFCLMQSPGM